MSSKVMYVMAGLLVASAGMVAWAASTVRVNGDYRLLTTDPSAPLADEQPCGPAHRQRMGRDIDRLERTRDDAGEWLRLESQRELNLLHRRYARCEGIDYRY